MRRLVNVSLIIAILAVTGGLLFGWVARMREAAARTECASRLHLLGVGIGAHLEQLQSFPCGTVMNTDLPPGRRLSWYVGSWAYAGDGQIHLIIDKTQAWDADVNRAPTLDLTRNSSTPRIEPVGAYNGFVCPADPHREGQYGIGLTHYIGIAGVGRDAAAAPVDYPQAGVFGYDRRTRLKDLERGLGQTLLIGESNHDNGPWTAGGPATVRGLDRSAGPLLGPGGQFGSFHLASSGLGLHIVTNFLYADGAVRSCSDAIGPGLLEALATLKGEATGEAVCDF
jgi:hypothetical protein